MQRILISILLVALLTSTADRPTCHCRKASENDIPHGANEHVVYEIGTVRKIHGRVTDPNGETMSDVVVEIYNVTNKNKNFEPYEIADSRKRRAACLTEKDGMFCFPDLPSGKYVLHIGTRESEGMNDVHVEVKLDRKW